MGQWKNYIWIPLFSLLFLAAIFLIKLPVETLFWLQPLFITINICAMITFFSLARKPISKYIHSVPKYAWILLILILLFGLGVRLGIPERLHKIYFDEDIYLNVAHNIANEGRACLCDYGTPEKCYSCIDNKQPMGMQTMHALFFRLFGWAGAGSELSVFTFNIIICSMAIVFIFTLAHLLTKSPEAGLIAALFLAITPEHIRWSVTTSQEAFFVTFLLLTASAFLLWAKRNSRPLAILCFMLAAYTIQLRTEGALILPILGVLVALTVPRPFTLLKQKEIIVGVFLLLLIILPSMLHTTNNKGDSWGAPDGKKFSAGYFSNNAAHNILYFIDASRFPLIFSIFALIGLGFGLIRHTKATAWLLLWFAAFFFMYAFFYAGSFDYGMDVRFALTMISPFLIIGAMGAHFIWGKFWTFAKWIVAKRKKMSKSSSRILKNTLAAILIAGIITGVGIIHFTQISQFGEQASDAMKVHEFAKGFAESVPENCLFLSQVSSMFINFGRPSIQTHMFLREDMAAEAMAKYDCIYMYWGYWCASSEPHRIEQCTPVLNKYNWEFVAQEQHYDRVFIFYKLSTQKI
jgi:hypothetical protein